MSSRRERLISSLRRKAESLGADVSDLTDEEMEARLISNSKALGSAIAAGIGRTAKDAASRVAALRRNLNASEKED